MGIKKTLKKFFFLFILIYFLCIYPLLKISSIFAGYPTEEPTPTKTPIPISCETKSKGDANCDNQINDKDFDIWKYEFLYDRSYSNLWSNSGSKKSADFNDDDKVDLVDFEIWRSKKFIESNKLFGCEWCGNECVKRTLTNKCIDVMPPENKICVYDSQVEKCVIKTIENFRVK